MSKESSKKKVAWGITGCGDKLAETLGVMKRVNHLFREQLDVHAYVSKAGSQVLKYYKLEDDLKAVFRRTYVEVDANTPFLAGWLQRREFEFLAVAPASSNTVAKIAVGICDSMLSNAAIMSMKAAVNVYVLPTDSREGTMQTRLPGGEDMNMRIRKEDVENVRKLATMENMYVLERPEEILNIFEKYFGTKKE